MTTEKDPLRIHFRVHRILTIGLLVLMGIVFYFSSAPSTTELSKEVDRFLQLIAVLFSIVSIFIGYRIYRKTLLQLRDANIPMQQRIKSYQRGMLYWWTLLLLPALFAVGSYFVTDNGAFLALSFCIWFVLALFAPSRALLEMLIK